ncbi:hypothetical protein LguiA_015996 [Lonicera macranthoides]
MMAQRHLHELLREDQEPFHLKDYIATKRCQIRRSKSTLHLNKIIKPNIIQPSTSKLSMCKHACLFSFTDSPDVRRSPFPSPAKSPCKSPSKVFLQILEAAARIQKQSSVKPKNQIKGTGFALFGSILKRLNRIKNREIGVGEASVLAKPHGEQIWKRKVKENMVGKTTGYETMGLSCSCSRSHSRSSAGWSEEKDMESSSCSSPSSPFRFSLQRSTSIGSRTPEFLSPAHRSKEEHNNYEEDNLQKVEVEVEEDEEEEKEQCSPVSVLDPPFEDNENRHEDGAEEEDVDDYDHDCSYAIVQKVKQQLLHKLRRFERLAELDPIELEKRMLEEQDDDDDDHEETEFADEESPSSYEEQESVEIVKEVVSKTNSHYLRKIPADMNMLVLDLISEEKRNGVDDSEVVVKRVCKKLDSWKEVESNTIDMMVELDFRREVKGWKKNDQEQMRETAMEIEFGIFGLLMEELSEELVSLAGI